MVAMVAKKVIPIRDEKCFDDTLTYNYEQYNNIIHRQGNSYL